MWMDARTSGSEEDVENLKLRNNLSESCVENLINLPYLHEPAILFCLQERYSAGGIYTYTGPILIALNPFKTLPLYSTQTLEVYYNSGLLRSQGIDVGAPLAPHVFAIADAAYREMMKLMLHGGHNSGHVGGASSVSSADQSILISGESGAGKTESTKIVLRYLTTVGNSTQSLETITGSIMDKVLQSNPILEAFGNARTLRNDNSSRFGKFIELNFNKRGSLIGGSIRTYLLEKVRLPSQQVGERSFHIFYQLFAGADERQREVWKLRSIEHYDYVAKGGIFKLQHMDDAKEFAELKRALTILNFSAEDQSSLLDAVVGIIHLGQVRFASVVDGEGEGSSVVKDVDVQSELDSFCTLCGLSMENVVSTLCVRTIVARDESYEKKLNPVQASDARDAVAKAIYGRLFDWIVVTINKCMEVEKHLIRASIGVLDIFGFESFLNNSFEQLCINYTNETLQQQFNQYIFKMEQLEYEREKIEWSFIEFPDNKDCLELIEHRTNGLFAMIDDECRLPKASDEKLASRMYKQFGTNKRFAASSAQKRDSKFCVLHYAGPVEYSTFKFVDKNKDELPKEAVSLLSSSSVPLLGALFTSLVAEAAANRVDKAAHSPKRNRTSSFKAAPTNAVTSVGIQFKEQLGRLMETVYATTPHYIRCLKPNDKNEPDNFNRMRVTEQLRYGGVLEAVRVARSGFPVRLSHGDFYGRYRLLLNEQSRTEKGRLPPFLVSQDRSNHQKVRECAETLLAKLWETFFRSSALSTGMMRRPSMKQIKELSKESIQLGLKKVFLRKDAHDVLESHRAKQMHLAARRIQTYFRCRRVLIWYETMKWACRCVQRLARGMFARSKARFLRSTHAAIVIQSIYRRHKSLRLYVIARKAIISIQRFRRKLVKMRIRRHCLSNRMATIISSCVFCVIHRRRFLALRNGVISLQCRSRMQLAKRMLRKLRVEAKDLGKLQQSNDALKLEIEALKVRAAEEKERMRIELEGQLRIAAQSQKEAELAKLRAHVEDLMRTVDTERNARFAAEKKSAAVLDRDTGKKCANCEKTISACQLKLEQYEKQLSERNEDVVRLEAQLNQALSSRPAVAVGTPTIALVEAIRPAADLSEKLSPAPQLTAMSRRRTITGYDSTMAADGKGVAAASFAGSTSRPIRPMVELSDDAAKKALEEEVSRLRKLSLEQQARIATLLDQQKPSANVNGSFQVGGGSIKSVGNVRRSSLSNLSPAARAMSSAAASDSTDTKPTTGRPINTSEATKGLVEQEWSHAWDDEDDSSEFGGSGQPSAKSESATTELSTTAKVFERNIELWRLELRQVPCVAVRLFCRLIHFTGLQGPVVGRAAIGKCRGLGQVRLHQFILSV